MTVPEKKEILRSLGRDVGFDRVGIARLGPAAGGGSFRRWVERGDHAEMSYMANRMETRLDPRRLFTGARSAVCVALQYHPESGEEPGGDLWPGVARYARGRDYHNVMLKRLRKLARRVRDMFPGTLTKPYVDTGPVLERDLATAAGLGIAGKNTMLLHPEAGSFFLLGELFTSLDLESDPPLADLCGSCTLCLDACPTGALPEPYRLDSRRCISYWTIEHRGSIPAETRSTLGEWVFGCDACQQACPHNDGAAPVADAAFELAETRRRLDLAALLEISEEGYQEIFQGSPMKRSRREGLRRNAALLMGNRGDQGYVPSLGRSLADSNPVIRSHVAWALGEIGGAEARDLLRRGLSKEADEAVRSEFKSALGRLEESTREARRQLS